MTRDELEGLRSKCYKEVLKISTRAQGISRFEVMLKDLSSSREEVVNAPNGQAKITSLTSQVRSLRTSMDHAAAEIDTSKRGTHSGNPNDKERIEELNRVENSKRNHAGMSSGVLDLKPRQAQQEEVALAAVDGLQRAEAFASDMQKEIVWRVMPYCTMTGA